MSFMFNPIDFDDPGAVNRINLDDETIDSVISGTKESAGYISNFLIDRIDEKKENMVIALDGYIGALWEQSINLISATLDTKSIKVTPVSFAEVFESSEKLDEIFAENLKTDHEKDPVLLFGKLYKGTFEDLLNKQKSDFLESRIKDFKNQNRGREVLIVFGCGCAIKKLRPLYDFILYYDITPKNVIIRARKGLFTNLGDTFARPINEFIRRCYYIDYEVALKHRRDLLLNHGIDFYIDSNAPDNLKLIPRKVLDSIMSVLVKYPMRCKPVYLEGVWGGQYFKKLRNLPSEIRNCAWVYDLIPLEVSIVVESGNIRIEFPFFTFVQKEGINLMGEDCFKKFNGYFPIRFNYDDTYHSNGNMSIQVHSGHDYNIENFNELGRQDESYYIVATGHGARTFIGFNENADVDEFIR
jgi:mannose-6-phosphate isomerase